MQGNVFVLGQGGPVVAKQLRHAIETGQDVDARRMVEGGGQDLGRLPPMVPVGILNGLVSGQLAEELEENVRPVHQMRHVFEPLVIGHADAELTSEPKWGDGSEFQVQFLQEPVKTSGLGDVADVAQGFVRRIQSGDAARTLENNEMIISSITVSY